MARKTAQEQLSQNLTAARGNLAALAAELDKLEREAATKPRNWGYAGDVGKVTEALADELESFGAKPARCTW